MNLNKLCLPCVLIVASDPALTDTQLTQKLLSNREIALHSLDEVISKYANKQDDVEEEERRKRLEKEKQKKQVRRGEKGGRGMGGFVGPDSFSSL